MKKVLSVLAALALAAVFVGTIAYLWKKSRKPPEVWETASPFVTDIVSKTVATGSVVPRKEVEIKPQVSGILEALLVEPGDVVRRGDVLARIRVVPNMASLAAAENRVARARIDLENAEREFERQRLLREEGILSDETFRRTELERSRARAEVQAATDTLDVVLKGTTKRAGDTSNTLVRATVDGTVLDVPAEEGRSVIESNTFNDGTTVATLADMSELVFEGKVDESEVGKLRPGMSLVLTIGAIEGKSFAATLEYIAPKGKEENGAIQFEIRAALSKDPGALIRANYSANADIVLDRRDKVLAIDEGLLKFEGAQAWVEVETAPQRFERRDVRTGLSDGISIEILEGLTEKDRVKSKAVTAAPRAS
ncbi:MAG TPA: efflux RND transporter periplasmic adaptor subunit [Candidatus Polarisedimenticolaceae bacterium]